VSFFGDSAGLVALLLFVAGETRDAFAVAALLLAGDFAPSLLSPFTGAISDRFERRRVMVVCELVQAAVVLIIAAMMPALPWLLALVALRSIAAQVFAPAARIAVPALVPDRQLEAANSALGFGANGMEAVGPLVAAALLIDTSIRTVLLLDAATFLISAAILARLPSLPPVELSGPRPTFVTDARAGLHYMAGAPLVRIIAVGFVAVVVFAGVDDVALVFLAKTTLEAPVPALAFLYGAVGLGLVAGYLVLIKAASRLPLVGLLVAGFVIANAGNLLTGLSWSVAAAFAFQFTRGLGISAIDVSVNTLLQREVPPELIGRVFGNLYGAVGAAAAVSYVLGALLLDLTDPRTTFYVAGSGGLVATLVMALALARRRPAH